MGIRGLTGETLTALKIDQVTTAFYTKVQRDPVLGPVFAAHVDDWPAHIDKISRFWRNAIQREKLYDGNPMIKHREAGNVRAEHFENWLILFDETVFEHLPGQTAQAWSDMAHRIGQSLQMGLSRSTFPTF